MILYQSLLVLSKVDDVVLLQSQKCRLSRTVLQGGEDVLLLPHVESAFLPRVLQLQGLEIVAEAAFSGSYHRHQAEVLELVCGVDRPFLAFKDDGHVELLDD